MTMTFEHTCVNLCKKLISRNSFPVKEFLEIKTLGKKSQFSEVLGQNVTGKKF